MMRRDFQDRAKGKEQSVDTLSSWVNWVGCWLPGGNVRLAAPVPEYAYFAEYIRQSAIADAVAQRSTAYLVRKRVDGLAKLV